MLLRFTKSSLLGMLFTFLSIHQVQAQKKIISGKPWYDTEGNRIEAHGGGILLENGVYYWYGENKSKGHGNQVGVSCYASKDLLKWENKGVVLAKTELPIIFQDSGVCERPKVLYNDKTKKYVMWMHLDAYNYTEASAGVAISDSPTGPFRFINYFRPIKYAYDFKETRPGAKSKEADRGNTFRDMNLFKDTDGKGYVFYASEDNSTMYVSQLNDDFTDIVRPEILGQTWNRIFIQGNREAPAPFKYKDIYYIITSGLTGWAPNQAQYATAKHILGPYEVRDNPCIGFESELTFRSQSTFVLPVPNGKPNQFIFMADRWLGNDITNSTYVWIPFYITDNGDFTLEFFDQWDFSIFNNKPMKISQPTGLNFMYKNSKPILVWNKCKGALMYNIYRREEIIGTTSENQFEIFTEIGNAAVPYRVVANYGFGADSKSSEIFAVQMPILEQTALTNVKPTRYAQGWGTLMRNRNIDDGPIMVSGKWYADGLGTHAPSEIHYDLNGKYSRFTALVGKTNVPVDGKIVFKVLGDGKLLAESNFMQVETMAQKLEADVRGIQLLTLIVEDGGDGVGYDHAAWIDPILWR